MNISKEVIFINFPNDIGKETPIVKTNGKSRHGVLKTITDMIYHGFC
jgi:hypothetical protein